MNDEERRIISDFVARISGGVASQGAQPWGGGSVPQSRPNLPPVDRDADQLIAGLFNQYPEARYRITQTAFVQEAALVEAQNRIRQLEWEVENARRQAQAAPPPQAAAAGGGFLGGLFGGGRQPAPQPQPMAAPMPPPPQPQYPPGYNPAMLQPQQQGRGSGFLGTALTTAAGVAGGLVVGNALMNMFSGHGHGATQAGGGLFGGGSSPWNGGSTQQEISSGWSDPGKSAWGQGGDKAGWGNQEQTNAGWATPASQPDQGGWGGDSGYRDDNSGGSSSSWDSGSSGSDSSFDSGSGGGSDDEY